MLAKDKCRNPGSNQRPSDLQSGDLPTGLSRLRDCRERFLFGGWGLVRWDKTKNATGAPGQITSLHVHRATTAGEVSWLWAQQEKSGPSVVQDDKTPQAV